MCWPDHRSCKPNFIQGNLNHNCSKQGHNLIHQDVKGRLCTSKAARALTLQQLGGVQARHGLNPTVQDE